MALQQAQNPRGSRQTHSGKPMELYYRLMTPEWLGDRDKKNADWDCTFEQQDLHLKIDPDSRDYERIFSVQLLDKSHFQSFDADLTVKIRAGLKYTGGTPSDPMSFTVSDRHHAFGFQLLDRTHYHWNGYGPYYPIKGASGQYAFNPPVIQKDLAKTSSDTFWPYVFEMRLKPLEGFGTIYTALDGGHMISAKFQKLGQLDQKGLYLEVYRGDQKEHYDVEYVEVTVTETQP